ncbi:MAG: hypothetical protein ACOC8A_01760 [bacterium]
MHDVHFRGRRLFLPNNTVAVVLLCPLSGAALPARAQSRPAHHRDVEAIAAGFEQRKARALKRIIEAEPPKPEDIVKDRPFVFKQVKALAILYHAQQTGDTSRVDEANRLLMEVTKLIGENDRRQLPRHAGLAIVLRTLILFDDRPDLLYPETKAKLKYGKEPDGTVDPKESLQHLLPRTCYDPGLHIGYYKWPTPFEGAAHYTENHRMSATVHGLLMCQVLGDQTYDPPDGPPLPVRSDDPDQPCYWKYWKKAFYDFLEGYEKPRYPIEPWQFEQFRHMDWGITEKDGTIYTQIFLGDFWILVDIIDDPHIAKYSEMFVDLILADYAEEAVKGVFVGPHENSEKDTVRGFPGFMAPYNHLLFDDLPYEPIAHRYYGWGSWGFLSLLTSPYNPTHPDFPKVLIDMAVNKPADGYMVREGINRSRKRIVRRPNDRGQLYARVLPDDDAPMRVGKPKATWVMPDYSLGFGIDSWVGWGYDAGGAYVATPSDTRRDAGLAVIPFGHPNNNHFDLKFTLICPMSSVVGKGAAITQCGTEELPAKLWIKDGFDQDFDTHDRWMFFAARSVLDRDVYVAVRPVLGSYRPGQPRRVGHVLREDKLKLPYQLVPQGIRGEFIAMDNPADFLVWEMSDGDRFASFEEFKQAVMNRKLNVDEKSVTYTSTAGQVLRFNRADRARHQLDGQTIDFADYSHVVNNPWGQWPQDAKKASFRSERHSAHYDFDPKRNGVFADEMPEKVVK